MRFSTRRNVDLPQPDGPISAVTRRAAIVSEQRSSTLLLPNHALTAIASSVAGSPSPCSRPFGFAASIVSSAIEVIGSSSASSGSGSRRTGR